MEVEGEMMKVNQYSRIEPDGEMMMMVGSSKLIIAELCLRILLFASSLTALLVMVTSTQVKVLFTVSFDVTLRARYTGFPPLLYIVVALSICVAYSFVTAIVTIRILKKRCSFKRLLNSRLVLICTDLVMVGVMAAATGAAGGVGSIVGFDGNTNGSWICNVFTKFCTYVGTSVLISFFVSVLLAVLVVLSVCSVFRLVNRALRV